jgi:hypothetical protein
MADADFVAARRQELLDGVKRWTFSTQEWGDPERFHVEVVEPLMELRYAGWFDEFVAPKDSIRGMLYVRSYTIISPVNYMLAEEEEGLV